MELVEVSKSSARPLPGKGGLKRRKLLTSTEFQKYLLGLLSVKHLDVLRKSSDFSIRSLASLGKSGTSGRRLAREVLGTQIHTIRLTTSVSALPTSGGGTVNQVVTVDPSGNADWSSGYAAIFDEYRVRKATLHVAPWANQVVTSTTALSVTACPTLCVVDYDSATALASASEALQYDTKKLFYLGQVPMRGDTYSIDFEPMGIPDLTWYDTSSITIVGWFKFYSLVATTLVSQNIGDFWVTHDVEFRQVI